MAEDPAESKRIAGADPDELEVGSGEWGEKDHLRTSRPQPPLATRHSPLTTHHFPEGGQRGEKDEPLPPGPEPEPPCRAQEARAEANGPEAGAAADAPPGAILGDSGGIACRGERRGASGERRPDPEEPPPIEW